MLKTTPFSTRFSVLHQNNNIKNNKLSFGMNTGVQIVKQTTSSLAPLATDLYNKTHSPIKIITETSQQEVKLPDETLQNNIDYEFKEKHKKAHKYLNNFGKQCTKVLTCIPLIGIFASISLASSRDEKLDAIYEIPEYIPVYAKNTKSDKLLTAITILHATIIGSVIATPLAIFTIHGITKEINKNLQEGYQNAVTKERETVKNETTYETRLRHAKMKTSHYKHIAHTKYKEYLKRQEEARKRQRYNRNRSSYNHSRPYRRTGGGR